MTDAIRNQLSVERLVCRVSVLAAVLCAETFATLRSELNKSQVELVLALREHSYIPRIIEWLPSDVCENFFTLDHDRVMPFVR